MDIINDQRHSDCSRHAGRREDSGAPSPQQARVLRLTAGHEGRTSKDLAPLHEAASTRIDDLTAAMVEEYGAASSSSGPCGVGRQRVPGVREGTPRLCHLRELGQTTVTLEPVGVAGLITAWNANALFICLKLARP